MNTIVREKVMVVALLVATLAIAKPVLAQPQVFRTQSQGTFATVNFFNPATEIGGFVLFSREPGEAGGFLTYLISSEGTITELGFGFVPAGEVMGGLGSLSVRTDTSASAKPDFTRLVGNGGLVAVDVKRMFDAPEPTLHICGVQQFSIGEFRLNSSGCETVTPGEGSGFVVLTEISGLVSGQLGMSRLTVVEILFSP